MRGERGPLSAAMARTLWWADIYLADSIRRDVVDFLAGRRCAKKGNDEPKRQPRQRT